jgi:hypothetical protein
MLATLLLSSLAGVLSAAEPKRVKTAVIVVTYETPNSNYLSLDHKAYTGADVEEWLYHGDGGSLNDPRFLSMVDFYTKATNGQLLLEPAIDSEGRGPVIEVVVSDDWALRRWGNNYSSTDFTQKLVRDTVMPQAFKKFNFYEFATTATTSGATVAKDSLATAFLLSGYNVATDYDYVMYTPNIDGGIGGPNIWGNSGGSRTALEANYTIPAGARSLVSPDLVIGGKTLTLSGVFTCTTGATSPNDNHWFGPSGVGLIAHELGHSGFNFVDLYDTAGQTRVNTFRDALPEKGVTRQDTPHPMRPGVGNWSVMAGGIYQFYTHPTFPTSPFLAKYVNPVSFAEPTQFRSSYFDAYNLQTAGVLPKELTDREGNVFPEYEGQTITLDLRYDTARLWIPINPVSGDLPATASGSNPSLANPAPAQQYFLLQGRAEVEEDDYDDGPFQTGRKFAHFADKYVNGGLLVLHIDPAYTTTTGGSVIVKGNTFTNQLAPLSLRAVVVEAHGGIQDMVQRKVYDRSLNEGDVNHGDPGDLFGQRVREFGPNTAPSNRGYYSPLYAAAPTNRYADARYDEFRQLSKPGKTLWGDSAPWFLSEIAYDRQTRKVSFRITTDKPGPTTTETKLAQTAVTSGDLDLENLLLDVTEVAHISEITVSDPAEAYKDNLIAIDVTADAAYEDAAKGYSALDGTEYRSETGALLVDVKLSVPQGEDYKLFSLLDDKILVDVTKNLPAYFPKIEGDQLTITTLVVDGRPDDYLGAAYSTENPNYAVKTAELADGRQVLVVYDGVKDGEANNVLFAVTPSSEERRSDGNIFGCDSGIGSLLPIFALGLITVSRRRRKV